MSLSYYHSNNCSDELFAQIYEGYEKRLREENLIDFDDMLVFCYELLKEREDIRTLWQNKFQHILIDEFQDINKVQYETYECWQVREIICLSLVMMTSLFIASGEQDRKLCLDLRRITRGKKGDFKYELSMQ